MSVFIRRFTFDPGQTVLLNIESVNILDLAPPSSIAGVGTGTALVVGEFENGAFGTVVEVTSPADLQANWGTLGYTVGGSPSSYPCAAARQADGALAAEYWNGNAFVQLSGKQFGRLLVCRVDTSVGAVQVQRLPFVTGASTFRYQLANGQILSLDVGSGYTSATFSGAAATITSSSQTIPTTFAGGETLTLAYDGNPQFQVTFLSTDQSQAAVISRINQYAGFTFAASVTGTTMSLTGLQQGLGGSVQVVSGSSGVLTKLGLTVGTTAGTGNVANVAAVSPTEVASVVQAAVSGTKVELDPNGALRVSNTSGSSPSFIAVGPATTAVNLGFSAGMVTALGNALVQSAAKTYPVTPPAGTVTFAIDGVQYAATFTNVSTTLANVVTAFNTGAGSTVAAADGTTMFDLFGKNVPGTLGVTSAVQIIGDSTSGTLLAALGLTVGTTVGTLPPQGILPAGTVVQVPSGQSFVTMQDVSFVGGQVFINGAQNQPVVQAQSGPWTVKVRPSNDNGTASGATAGTVTQVTYAPLLGAFSVLNPQVISSALTEGAIDAAYSAALTGPTLDISSVAKQANLIYSARQSNTVRRGLRTNALTASASGMLGRMAVGRPPLGTSKAVAMSTFAEPGVGAYRDQRFVYTFPGVRTFVPMIATRGVSGGAGFTASGNVDVGSDGFMVSVCSQLPPEENPGQETGFTGAAISLESSPNAQGYTMADYINFKAAGIAAPRFDDGVMVFQSGVTSVDPLVNGGLVRISRRRMADYIQDSIAIASKSFGKRLSTVRRRAALASEVLQFAESLLSRNNPDSQRIAGYTLDAKSGNTLDSLGAGEYRIIFNVRTLASLDSIVFQMTVGEQVQVQELLPQAA